jgi:hypothetical protein
MSASSAGGGSEIKKKPRLFGGFAKVLKKLIKGKKCPGVAQGAGRDDVIIRFAARSANGNGALLAVMLRAV